MSQVVEPIQGPVLDEPLAPGAVEAPRLARHQITLADGHQVGVTVAGKGVPLVVVHGFSVEGFLYAQSLSRLVSMGFRVIAIDTAGHGATQGLPLSGQNLNEYAALLGRVVDELGITHYLLAGHSMGGQLVTRLAASRPEQVMGVVLIDAIVGDTWDRMVYLFRVAPPLLSAVGAALLVDSAMVVPAFTDPRQATKLLRLVVPTLVGHATHPWRLLGPTASSCAPGPAGTPSTPWRPTACRSSRCTAPVTSACPSRRPRTRSGAPAACSSRSTAPDTRGHCATPRRCRPWWRS
ncbi:MAG: alpha/beta fold hydrolase [Actinomycetes bacterium]